MFESNEDFYPTPRKLIDKMLAGIDFNLVRTFLEPSAGKGDIVDVVVKRLDSAQRYNRQQAWDIDTIEIDNNLQHILKGKEYRVIHDDFLTFSTFKKYDLIVMNPPFSDGDKHLLKAIELQESGGQIVCLLNAETLRNPFSNSRKDLLRKLEDHQAEVEYIEDAFLNAERSTCVEVALIKLNIPKPDGSSIILDDLKKRERPPESSQHANGSIINADFIRGIIQQYDFEVKAGLKLIAEYEGLRPFILDAFKRTEWKIPSPVLALVISGKENNEGDLGNNYLKQIRRKYWEALFMSDEFMGLFTSNLREKYVSQINELIDYDFSFYNIYTIRIQINKEMIKALEETIMALFEEFSNKWHYYDEMSKNVHYYSGWKTNSAYKVNKKVIIPLRGFSSWSGRLDYSYDVARKLSDIEKVFNYLDAGMTDNIDLHNQLRIAENCARTKKIELKYFTVTFYKKGTCHIEFTNLDVLGKFNIYGSQHKNWLPPVYGKARYQDMTTEEQETVDNFEGEASYNKVMLNPDYYIVETSQLLMLA